MKKLMRFHHSQKGFTLIELLIVVAILGILAAVIVPNLAGFLTTGNVAAANTEVANVESAALAFYADNDGTWPSDTTTDLAGYLSDSSAVGYDYTFDSYGKVVVGSEATWDSHEDVVWNPDDHKWEKG